MANHFLVFIGGTGAKCAEAFVQLAAAGALGGSSDTYHLMTMDVDAANGNRRLAIEAVHRYQLLREQFPATGRYSGSSLFRTRIEHYDWHVRMPDTFHKSAGVNCLNAMRTQNNDEEEELLRLLYTDAEMGFDFSLEGFHAIPAIGAPVLQYILGEGVGLEGCRSFVEALQSEVSAHSRLIVIGSIFGGTGACGVPAMLRFLTDQLEKVTLAGRIHTHAVLLLPYYHFAEPTVDEQLAVHARKFYNNARGALAFYRSLGRELKYESLYLLGSPVDYNMGAYHPGMERQQNPPTPVEWESAFAIAHCVEQPWDAGSVRDGPRQFIRCMSGASEADTVHTLHLSWNDWGLPVREPIGTLARFIAAFMGYYRHYIAKNLHQTNGLKPFFQELILPYLLKAEPEYKGFTTLEAFCSRAWTWMRDSVSHEVLEQACFTERMMLGDAYPYRALNALIRSAPAPRWTTVEDAIFDGIRPLLVEDADAPQFNAGQFVHGLYAHCAP